MATGALRGVAPQFPEVPAVAPTVRAEPLPSTDARGWLAAADPEKFRSNAGTLWRNASAKRAPRGILEAELHYDDISCRRDRDVRRLGANAEPDRVARQQTA